jgi:F-type H+-transporting ATPase subunit a
MDEIGRYALVQLPGGFSITQMDWQSMFGMWVIMAFLLVLSWSVTRDLKIHPGRLQYLMEIIVSTFDQLCKDSIGAERGRKFLSLVGSTFLLLLFCNWFGSIPGMIEPTKNINTTLGLALVGFAITLAEAIRIKGVGSYIGQFFEPFAIMAPMNLIGEVAKVVSISCRLFGNIMGGAIIIEVVSYLMGNILAPIPLVAYFGIAVGFIQAFVFTMLTMTYLAVAISDD